jgi:hypothetical protein
VTAVPAIRPPEDFRRAVAEGNAPRHQNAIVRAVMQQRADGAESRETALVAAIAVLACVRVLAFASAFPLFDNIDEYRHADRVLKYARGYWPGPELPPIEPELAEAMARYGSPEYTRDVKGSLAPKPPEELGDVMRAIYDHVLAGYRAFASVDAQQPPLYPLIVSRWYRLGKALGFEGIDAFYFVRWLNGPLSAALVVVSWLFLRRSHSERRVRLAVLLWIALYPGDFLYGITDDAFLPLLGALAFAALLCATAASPTRTSLAAAAGGAAALALLDKWFALAFLPVVALLATARLLRALGTRTLVPELRAWFAFSIACTLPVALWMTRNARVMGDAMGLSLKSRNLSMLRVPASDWLAHPIFRPSGMLEFANKMVPTFWRGEFSWHGEAIHSGALDQLYVTSTVLAFALALVACWRARRGSFTRQVEASALVAGAAAFGMIAATSVVYRFDPFRWGDRHYLSTGRYAAWALMPIAIAYVRGIEFASRAAPARWRGIAFWCLIGAVLAASTIGEIVLHVPVFASRWNWYHWR